MKKYVVCNVAFFAFLAVIGLLFYINPNKLVFSNLEGRDLAKAPEISLKTLLNGSNGERVTTQYENYFSDHFPMREELFSFAEAIRNLKGMRDPDDVYFQETGGTAENGGFMDEEDVHEEEPETNVSVEEKDPDVVFDEGKYNGSILVCDDTAMEIIYQAQGNNNKYAAAINKFAEKYPDIQVNCLVVPNQAEFKMPDKFRYDSNNQKTMIDYIYGKLDSDIHKIDAYSALKKHADEYIYLRTDHHWTGLGAYYAYTAFVKQNGLTAIPIKGYEEVLYENVLGSLYRQLKGNKSKLAENADRIIAYNLPVECEVKVADSRDGVLKDGNLLVRNLGTWNKYMGFLGGDHNYVRIRTNNKNGKKIIVFKESYGNAFIPFLTANYEEIHVIDSRKGYKKAPSQIIAENGITEALFINYIVYPNVTDRVKELVNRSSR